MSDTARSAPSRAKATACDLPCPRAAPVMNTDLPSNRRPSPALPFPVVMTVVRSGGLEDGDDLADGALVALFSDELHHPPGLRRLDLGLGLVGLDLAQGLALLDLVAHPLQPGEDRHGLDGQPPLGDLDLARHAERSRARTERQAASTLSALSRMCCSIGGENGTGTFSRVTRRTGALRASKQNSPMDAAASLANEHSGVASSTTTTRPVLRAEANSDFQSIGTMVRGSSSSTDTPSSRSRSAAASADVSAEPSATIVRSSPSRMRLASPNGISSSSSGSSSLVAASAMLSRNITGSSSRIAVLSRPFASRGPDGTTTLRPGMCAKSACGVSECCAPAERPMATAARIVSGTLTWSPLMYRALAIWFTSWSKAM